LKNALLVGNNNNADNNNGMNVVDIAVANVEQMIMEQQALLAKNVDDNNKSSSILGDSSNDGGDDDDIYAHIEEFGQRLDDKLQDLERQFSKKPDPESSSKQSVNPLPAVPFGCITVDSHSSSIGRSSSPSTCSASIASQSDMPSPSGLSSSPLSPPKFTKPNDPPAVKRKKKKKNKPNNKNRHGNSISKSDSSVASFNSSHSNQYAHGDSNRDSPVSSLFNDNNSPGVGKISYCHSFDKSHTTESKTR